MLNKPSKKRTVAAGLLALGILAGGAGIMPQQAGAAAANGDHIAVSNGKYGNTVYYTVKVNYDNTSYQDLQKLLNQNLSYQDLINLLNRIQLQQPAVPVQTPPRIPVKPPVVQKPATPVKQPAAPAAGSVSQSEFAKQVVTLVNQERAKAGLKPLASDAALTRMATDKAKDMLNKNYFDHNSPTYGSPFDMMRKYGISYRYAGENIAKGQRSPQEVMTAWMNSQGHRANILSGNYTKIGVAYVSGEWVQEFIG